MMKALKVEEEKENTLRDMLLFVLIPVFFLILLAASVPAILSEHL